MKKRYLSIVALCAACVLAGSCLTMALNPSAAAEETQTVTQVVTSPFTSAVAQVRDSVVGVYNYQKVRYSNSYGSWADYFGFGFPYDYGGRNGRDNGDTTQEVKASFGSGVVIAKGYVLTNNHVVDEASSLKIAVMEDNENIKEYDAILVASDANLDVAIVYCPDLELEPVTLGDSDNLMVGDWAICIGNPLSDSFFGTVTTGVVSALNRSVSSTSTDRYGRRETITNTMIQVDAAINNGNSGGGMFSVSGELMGIPTIKYSGSAYSGASIDGIGMCIPINAAKPLITDVLSGVIATPDMPETEEGEAAAAASNSMIGKPRMGVSIKSLNPSSSVILSGALPNGVYVDEVEAGTPAEAAGMLAGDIIVDCNDTVITSVTQLQGIIAACNEGDTLKIKVYRAEGLADWMNSNQQTDVPEGEYVDLEVTLAVVDVVKQ